MDNLTSEIRDGFMPGNQYKATDFVSKEYLGSLDLKNMEGEQVLEESSGNYHAKENVTSAFFRFDQNLGKKLKMMLGLRMEATHIKYDGWNWMERKTKRLNRPVIIKTTMSTGSPAYY